MQRKILMLLLAMFLMPAVSAPVSEGAAKGYARTVENYAIPEVTLVNQDGKKTRLQDLLRTDKPVLVDFVYTTCTTICPVLSANFSNFQRTLGPEAAAGVRLISISIDPEYDSPKAMKSYLTRYAARPGWEFLTGSRQDIEKVLKAMNAYTSNKMDHVPVILMRAGTGGQWVRLSGLIGTTELVKEYEQVKK